jgi:hypothetical protein
MFYPTQKSLKNMINLTETNSRYDSTKIDVDKEYNLSRHCQQEILNELLKVNFTMFGTVQLNFAKQVNSSIIERSFRFVRAVKNNIANNFSGNYQYFIRPAHNGTLHYHFLIKTRPTLVFKRDTRLSLLLKKIETDYDFASYTRLKKKVFKDLKDQHFFPAAQLDLKRAVTDNDRTAFSTYVVFNKHNPDLMHNVDLKRYFTGDKNFCFSTNIWS